MSNYQTWDPITALIQVKKLFNEESIQTSQADREQEVLCEDGILDDKKKRKRLWKIRFLQISLWFMEGRVHT